MNRLAIATAIGSLMGLGGCGSSSTPTTPTPTPSPSANISGRYDLTLTAASTCSENLAPETRVIKYVADISQTGAGFNVTLLGHVIFTSASVIGTVSGQTVTFSTFSFSDISTGGGIALASSGTANVAADGSMTGTLNGTFQSPAGPTCNATNHQVQLVKRLV